MTLKKQQKSWLSTNSVSFDLFPVWLLLSFDVSSARLPDIPGLEDFKGASFHTSEWKKEFAPKGKRIAVIGTGASAVQVIPALANQQPANLTVFQR